MVAMLLLSLLLPAQIPDRETYEVWLCPVHRDEQAAGPGRCPVEGRELVRRLLVPSYSCPMHQHIDEEEPGQCPICKMDLVPTTRELEWFCTDYPEVVSSAPGNCPDGSAMDVRSIPMAHGDHNPKHGGILFMAPDGFHHIEGTLDAAGRFRLYIYDDFTKPMAATGFEARVGVDENDAEATRLVPAEGGAFLEAVLPVPERYPVELVAHVGFPGTHESEARFDFIFAGTEQSEAASALGPPELRIPETSEGIYEAISERNARLVDLIERGAWADLYIPALEAKDLVLALARTEGERIAAPAKKLVRAAWLLDTYGDLGNRLEVEKAYRLFEKSIRELEATRAR